LMSETTLLVASFAPGLFQLGQTREIPKYVGIQTKISNLQ